MTVFFAVNFASNEIQAFATNAQVTQFVVDQRPQQWFDGCDAMSLSHAATANQIKTLIERVTLTKRARFSDRSKAFNALDQLLADLISDGRLVVQQPAPTVIAQVPAPRRGRLPKFDFSGRTIRVAPRVLTENPRREGSAGFHALEILRARPEGLSYEQYVAAGGARNHLTWDFEHNFVELV